MIVATSDVGEQQPTHLVSVRVVVSIFIYLSLATLIATLLLLLLDGMVYGAMLANARTRSQLRKKQVLNQASAATLNTGVDSQASSSIGTSSASTSIADNSPSSTSVDRNYATWLNDWTSTDNYVRALEEQARFCWERERAEDSASNPKVSQSDRLLNEMVDNFPRFVHCGLAKTLGVIL